MVIAIWMTLPFQVSAQVKVGAARTNLYYPALKNKKVGIVANKASVVDHINIVDFLVKDGIEVERIFSPEHGFRIYSDAGEKIQHSTDSATGIRVVSLYGNQKRPSAADLNELEIILFDIQDVGVRFYTYISTLTYMMETCAEHHIPLILLDRPNPNGFYIDGPVLEKEFSSFVGLHPVPIVYGMTIGEYAQMVNGEKWLPGGISCDLTVITVEHYTHICEYIIPVKPSPNLPNLNAVMLYPSLCLFEGTVVSVGRGTLFPFEVFGHPDFTEDTFLFTPRSIPGMSTNPPYSEQVCYGKDLRDFYKKKPEEKGKINLGWMFDAFKAWHGKPDFFTRYFNQLAGNELLQKQIIQGLSEKKIRASWKPGLEKFKKIRKKYLLY
jgi:uncharacterized protein YbbC (DUF1343 family)